MQTQPILISGDTRAVLSAFTPEPVSLASLTAAGVAIEWHEGVAIIQEASRLLLESTAQQSDSELSSLNVRIDSGGAVLVPRGGVQNGPSAVFQLGTLLRDLLPESIPVPLRLAISQAMSQPPHYTWIESFSEALSYFERPDRAAIIRGVYARWEANAGGRATVEPRRDPARTTPPPAETPAAKERTTKTTPAPTRRWLVVAGSVALAMALGVVAAVWFPQLDRQTIVGLTRSSQPTSDGSSDAETANPAEPQAANRSTGSRASVAPAATRRDSNPNTDKLRARESSVVFQPLRALSLSPAAPTNDTPAASDLRQHAGSPPPETAYNTAPLITLVEAGADSRIYSAFDTEVAAPVAAHPQSSSVATVLDDDEMLTFDLVIDQTGKVESVKLRRAPRSIRSALMLTMSMSVAKAWRFQPATRHGQSVKYRQSVSVPAPQ